MGLKLGGQLAHEMIQRILWKIKVPQILKKESSLFKGFSDMTLFPDESYYSFHQMRLKLVGQLDYEVVQGRLFQGYSIPNW